MLNLNPHTRFSKEMRLLTLTAKTQLTAANRAEIKKLVGAQLDWNLLLKLATSHHTKSLLNRHLQQELVGDAVPQAIREGLKLHFEQTLQWNLFLTRELLNILKLFAEHGIPAAPFKGPLLALRHYENIGYRSFLDLDILVPKHVLLQCAKLLEGLGYVRPQDQIGPKEQEHLDAQLGFDFRRRDGKVLVELHWALIQKWLCFHLAPEALWQRAGRARLAGLEVAMLAPEDTLLFLCAHGAKHQWERMIWITDIGEVIRSDKNLDWEQLLHRAGQTGSRRVLLWGLQLAYLLVEAEVPAQILDCAAKDFVIARLTKQTIDEFASQQAHQPGPDSKSSLMFLATKERLMDKSAYLIHMLRLLVRPTAKDRSFAKLPQSLSILHFLIRPLRVLVERLSAKPEHKFEGS